MPIGNITQSVSTIPAPPHRGVDVQTVFVNMQEDFQDHLTDTTVAELNTLKDQLNSRIGEINSTATTMNGYASTASVGASTATTKAGEASTSASGALTSRNQAETFNNNASASATKAGQWADNNYNVAVETGKYSAKHWATVAQNASGEDIKGSNIASAATTTIGTAGLGDYIHITGTATITSFGTAANAGVKRTLIFDAALTITNGTNLICVGGANILTVANTIVSVIAETTTQWRVECVTHPSISFAELGYLDGATSSIQTQINNKANIVSPTFTGIPTAPTASAQTNNTQLATTEFVTSAVTSAVANPDVYQGPYGFNWDYSTDTYIRTGAAGYTAIQSMMKRCVLNANGTVNYYLHPTNSNFKADETPSILTGANGNVMVEVPKFYAKIETVGNVDKYSISLTADVGYVVHPWFVKAGVEVPFRYYRAYTGFNSGGTLKSISGVTPTRTQTIATFRSQAIANGAGWHLTDWNAVNAIKLLCYIEFNDYIVTDYIGTGNDTGSDYGLTTGQSNAIGNTSSPSTNNNTWMSYRGIENFYADCWEFLDGVNINNYVFYVNQNYTTFASDVFTGDYVSKGTTIAASASYITRCAVSVSGGWIPSVIGGASTTYYGDGFWSATGARVACFGGSTSHGALGGAGAMYVSGASSYSNADIGGAVCF